VAPNKQNIVKNSTEDFLEIFDSLHQNLLQLEDGNISEQKKLAYSKSDYSYESFSNLLYKLRFKHNWLNGKNYYFLKTCSKIRNIIAHNNHLQPFKEFNPIYIEKLESFNARFFTSIFDHSIKRQKISHLSWNTSVSKAIKELKSKNFSSLPILEDGYVKGIFNKAIIFDFLSEQEECTVNGNLKLTDLKEYAKLELHLNKTIAFVDKDESLSDVFNLFSDYYGNGKKLILVFITEDGKEDQRIMGMYTVWDFLKSS